MSDPTYKTGAQSAIREEGAPEEEIPHHRSQTKQQWYREREIESINRRLDEGNRQFAQLRTSDENQTKEVAAIRLEFTQKFNELQMEFTRKLNEAQSGLTGKISQESTALTGSFKVLEDKVAPRVTIWKVMTYVAAIVIPAGVAIAGWIWFAAKYPDRIEFEKLKDQQHRVEVKLAEKGMPIAP